MKTEAKKAPAKKAPAKKAPVQEQVQEVGFFENLFSAPDFQTETVISANVVITPRTKKIGAAVGLVAVGYGIAQLVG